LLPNCGKPNQRESCQCGKNVLFDRRHGYPIVGKKLDFGGRGLGKRGKLMGMATEQE
jgi:hypothetical protein